MAIDRWGAVMRQKAEPSFESLKAVEEAAVAARLHRGSTSSFRPPAEKTGSVAVGLKSDGSDALAETARLAIDSAWQKLGGSEGPLGRPMAGGQVAIVDHQGGRAGEFEGGYIYWWSDTGPIALSEVVVRYRGMICFAETDWDMGSDSDEPYFIFSYIGDSGSGTHTPLRYEDVDGGEAFNYPVFEVYRGAPGRGLVIPTVLMEQDYGDPAHYHSLVATATGIAATSAIGLVGMIFSAGAATAATPAIISAVPYIVEQIDSALGTADDRIGQTVLSIPAKDLCTYWARPYQYERGVEFDVATDSIIGHGAQYKAYFDAQCWTWEV